MSPEPSWEGPGVVAVVDSGDAERLASAVAQDLGREFFLDESVDYWTLPRDMTVQRPPVVYVLWQPRQP